MPAPALTPEHLFCVTVAKTLDRSELEHLLVLTEIRALGIVNRHDWINLAASLRHFAQRAAPDQGDALDRIDAARRDPAVRNRARKFLHDARDADPVDALADAELLVSLMRARLADVVSRHWPIARDS